jgi:hypothetical protein
MSEFTPLRRSYSEDELLHRALHSHPIIRLKSCLSSQNRPHSADRLRKVDFSLIVDEKIITSSDEEMPDKKSQSKSPATKPQGKLLDNTHDEFFNKIIDDALHRSPRFVSVFSAKKLDFTDNNQEIDDLMNAPGSPLATAEASAVLALGAGMPESPRSMRAASRSQSPRTKSRQLTEPEPEDVEMVELTTGVKSRSSSRQQRSKSKDMDNVEKKTDEETTELKTPAEEVVKKRKSRSRTGSPTSYPIVGSEKPKGRNPIVRRSSADRKTPATSPAADGTFSSVASVKSHSVERPIITGQTAVSPAVSVSVEPPPSNKPAEKSEPVVADRPTSSATKRKFCESGMEDEDDEEVPRAKRDRVHLSAPFMIFQDKMKHMPSFRPTMLVPMPRNNPLVRLADTSLEILSQLKPGKFLMNKCLLTVTN